MRSKLFIIVFLFLCPFLMAQEDVRILSSNSSSLIIEYIPQYVDTISVSFQNQTYIQVILKGASFAGEEIGTPELPMREINLGVPSEFNNSIQILSSEFSTIDAKLSPVPSIKLVDEMPVYEYKASENYTATTEKDIVTFGEYGIIRVLPVQSIDIFPIQFDSATNQIKLFKRIVFQINFVNDANKKTVLKNNFLKDVVLNYNSAKNWGIVKTNGLKKDIATTVLSSGSWSKFKVTKEGLYKIDRAKLASYGIDASSVDPRTIKIYSNGGYLLPEKLTTSRPSDLVENSIKIIGEGDGSFNEGDYILFYARGIDFWEYDVLKNQIIRNTHWYSKENFYWITSGGEPGKRMGEIASLSDPSTVQQVTTKAFIAFEEDKINLMKTGRVYVGDDFSSASHSRTYVNTLNNRVAGSEIRYDFQFVNYSGSSAIGSVPLTVSESNNTGKSFIFYLLLN